MYELLIAEMRSQPWAILPEKLAVISDLLAFRASGQRYTPEEIQARIGVEAAASRSVSRAPGMVAVLPITGVLQNRAGAMEESSGVTGMNKLQATFRALVNDPEIKAIVLDINSPGGSVYGTQEFAQAIFESRAVKPVVAVANHMAASAAFWIMSAAGEAYVSPSGQVGSVGVVRMHEDVSKMAEKEGVKVTFIHSGQHKVEGNPFEPLSEETVAHLQAQCDKMYAAFVGDLARNRGVSRAHVEANFGQGRMFLAKDAVAAGMADGVRSLEQVLAKLGAGSAAPARGGMRAEMIDDDWLTAQQEDTARLGQRIDAFARDNAWPEGKTVDLTDVVLGEDVTEQFERRVWTEEEKADKLAALGPKPISREEQRVREGVEPLADERDAEHVRRARELALAKARYS